MRNLKKDEIECRLQTATNSTAQFLLYKTPRTDVKLLTETYGDMWKNEFQCIDGKLYCTISVWNDKIKSWVSRSNVGTESNIEQEKGQASDAIKRAGFMWEIGTELYTAPQIKVDLTPNDLYNGKCTLKLSVKDIEISPEHKITKLILVDRFGNERFNWSYTTEPKSTTDSVQLKPLPNNGDNRDFIIQSLRDAANKEYTKEGVNKYELKKFVEFYKNKIEANGWKWATFDFDKLFTSWMSRVYKGAS